MQPLDPGSGAVIPAGSFLPAMQANSATRGPSGAMLRAQPAGAAHQQQGSAAQIFGDWRLTRFLDRGRWTLRFRACPTDSPKCELGDYVVELLAPDCAGTAEGRATLRRTAQVSRAVQHPHLCPVLADHTAGERPFVVFPWLAGTSLRQVLDGLSLQSNAEPGLPVPLALWISRQMAEALLAMHQAGWLHGNMAPDHTRISPPGHATLTSLGLARRIESAECRQENGLILLPAYAPPEAFARDASWSAASDVYSLGIVLFEMLTGRPPFSARDAATLARQHRLESPPHLTDLRWNVSREVAQLVQRMLAKEPLRRPSGAELVRWLTELEIAELGVV